MFTKINTKINEARDEEGFTLIELLVVILIIGILAAIAIPVFLNQQKAAVKAGVKSDVRNTATNVATSLVTSPSATGFTTYAVGTTAPIVTGGAVAVQTVNTNDDTITITKNPASGSAPSTGTGAGQWDDYQIVGTSARVPNYCFVFSSVSGKYTEYNDCTVAAGSGSGTGTGTGSTITPTASPSATATTPPTPTTLATFGFGSVSPWVSSNNTALSVSSSYNHGTVAGGNSMQVFGRDSAGSTSQSTATLYSDNTVSPFTITSGSTYTVTAWVYQTVVVNPYISAGGQTGATSGSTTNGWMQINLTFTATDATAKAHFPIEVVGSSKNGYAFYLDDVTITKVS